jgi:hypothetical protein
MIVQQPPARSGFLEIVKTFALFGILVNLSIGLWMMHRMHISLSNREYGIYVRGQGYWSVYPWGATSYFRVGIVDQ